MDEVTRWGNQRISAPNLSFIRSTTSAWISLTSSFDSDLRPCQELKRNEGGAEGCEPIHRPVVYPVANTPTICLRVSKGINLRWPMRQLAKSAKPWTTHHLDIFCQIARDVSDQVTEIVLVQPRLRYPEADVLEARRILGVGFECSDPVLRELGEDSRVGGPEETNIRDAEEDHGDPFEAKAERPADIIRNL